MGGSERHCSNTYPDLHFLQFIKACMPSTDPVTSSTNCHGLLVSYLTQYTASSSRNAQLSQLDLVKLDILKHFLSFTVGMQTLCFENYWLPLKQLWITQWGSKWWMFCRFLFFQPTKGKIFSLLCWCFRICSMCSTSSSQQFIFSPLFNVLNFSD